MTKGRTSGESTLFSVVIPLYNKEKYIGKAVNSVLSQSLSDLQLIVVDDGSTDSSLEIVDQFSDHRLIVLRQENSGVSAARNAGIARSRGEWVAFLDADDFWMEDHLDELASISRKHPACNMLATSKFEIREDDIVKADDHDRVVREISYFDAASEDIGIVHSSTASIRRSALDDMDGFREFKAGEDLEFWARVALSNRVAISTRRTACYVRETGGAMEVHEEESRSQPRVVNKAKDISPSVATLMEALPDISDTDLRRSVVRYINSRITSAIVYAVRWMRIEEARHLIKFYLGKPGGRTGVIIMVLSFPSWIIRSAVRVIVACRRTRSSLSNVGN